eukprot:CAMPEP_0170330140 /NCGR_PEP_ID=MMETSP0116_2-20130129/66000_1 /TAXON_ID=400756 /ORGANISM="Durinskia baltica, Strain CSIRO CS-38" /LENGTH=32 /DNA_ID= /DNA_START= /DNA_END= /DNA_ORIENTATION=
MALAWSADAPETPALASFPVEESFADRRSRKK